MGQETPKDLLLAAVKKNQKDEVQSLCNKERLPRPGNSKADEDTTLTQADIIDVINQALPEHADCVNYLIDFIDINTTTGTNGLTLLYTALYELDIIKVHFLIENLEVDFHRHTDPNFNLTPIEQVIYRKKVKIIDKQNDINRKPVLSGATRERKQNILLKYLVEKETPIARDADALAELLNELIVFKNTAAFHMLLRIMLPQLSPEEQLYVWKKLEIFTSPDWMSILDTLQSDGINLIQILRLPTNSDLFATYLTKALSELWWKNIFNHLKVSLQDFHCNKELATKLLGQLFDEFINCQDQAFTSLFNRLLFLLEIDASCAVNKIGASLIEKAIDKEIVKDPLDFLALTALFTKYGLNIKEPKHIIRIYLNKLATSSSLAKFHSANLLAILKNEHKDPEWPLKTLEEIIAQISTPMSRIQENIDICKQYVHFAKIKYGTPNELTSFKTLHILHEIKQTLIYLKANIREELDILEKSENDLAVDNEIDSISQTLDEFDLANTQITDSIHAIKVLTMPDWAHNELIKESNDIFAAALAESHKAILVLSTASYAERLTKEQIQKIVAAHAECGINNNVAAKINMLAKQVFAHREAERQRLAEREQELDKLAKLIEHNDEMESNIQSKESLEDESLLHKPSSITKKIPYLYSNIDCAYAVGIALEVAGTLFLVGGAIAALPAISASLTVIVPIVIGASMYMMAAAILGKAASSETSKSISQAETELIASKDSERGQRNQSIKIASRKCGIAFTLVGVNWMIGVIGGAAALATLGVCIAAMSTGMAMLAGLSLLTVIGCIGAGLIGGITVAFAKNSFFGLASPSSKNQPHVSATPAPTPV